MAGGADALWLTVWRGTWPGSHRLFTFSNFQSGGAGARADKDGLQTNGYPSGVAGVPAEVVETWAPLVMHRKALVTDSGGAGRARGGLSQEAEISYRGDGRWGVSTLIERTRFPGNGLAAGSAEGARGRLRALHAPAQPGRVPRALPDAAPPAVRRRPVRRPRRPGLRAVAAARAGDRSPALHTHRAADHRSRRLPAHP